MGTGRRQEPQLEPSILLRWVCSSPWWRQAGGQGRAGATVGSWGKSLLSSNASPEVLLAAHKLPGLRITGINRVGRCLRLPRYSSSAVISFFDPKGEVEELGSCRAASPGAVEVEPLQHQCRRDLPSPGTHQHQIDP